MKNKGAIKDACLSRCWMAFGFIARPERSCPDWVAGGLVVVDDDDERPVPVLGGACMVYLPI